MNVDIFKEFLKGFDLLVEVLDFFVSTEGMTRGVTVLFTIRIQRNQML